MAQTTNYNFEIPDDTDLVKDGALAMRDLGQDVDTAMFTALAGQKAGMFWLNTTSFSAVSGVDVNNVFNEDFQNYRVILKYQPSSAADVLLRFRSVGGTSTVANYFYTRLRHSGAASTTTFETAANQTSILLGNENTSVAFDLYDIQKTGQKSGVGVARKPTRVFETVLYGTIETTVFTGLNLSIASGDITGTIQVFGYKD
jgi:hypothetical protein